MSKIIDGIVRFKSEVYPARKALFNRLAEGQHPEALFITCSDSRINPNLLVNTEPGELFIIRNAGNIVPPHNNYTGGVTASIEYAVAALGIEHIVICGHTDCGAMGGVMRPEETVDLPHVSQWLSYAKAAKQIVEERLPNASYEERMEMLTEENVLLQLRHIQTHPHVAAKFATGKVHLHAWVYNIGTGDVKAYDDKSRRFVAVEACYQDQLKPLLEENSGPCSCS